MQEYARELISLVDAMSRICSIERANAKRSGVLGRLKTLLRLPWRSNRSSQRFTRGRRAKSIGKRFCMSYSRISSSLRSVDRPLMFTMRCCHSSRLLHGAQAAQGRLVPESHTACAEHHPDSCPRELDVHRPGETVIVGARSSDEAAGHEVRHQGRYGYCDPGIPCLLREHPPGVR